MEFTKPDCGKIGMTYYEQRFTRVEMISCPVCKEGAIIFGIQADGMTFHELHQDDEITGGKILHFHCDNDKCGREGGYPS